MSRVPDGQTLQQGVADLRQTWEHLARELAPGVPELPGVIDQELSGLAYPDLTEENLIRVAESVVGRVANAGFPEEATALFRRMGRAMYELLLLFATSQELRELAGRAHQAPPPVVGTAAPSPPAAGSAGLPLQPAPAAVAPAAAEPPRPTEPQPPVPVSAEPVVAVAPPTLDAPSAALQPRDPARPASRPPGVAPVAAGAAALPARPSTEALGVRTPGPGSTNAPPPPAELSQPSQPPPPPHPLPAAAEAPAPVAPAASPGPPLNGSLNSAPSMAPPATPVAAAPVSEDDAPLWGFDPAARDQPVHEVDFPETFPEAVPPESPPVGAGNGASAETGVAPAAAVATRSSWTVRLSPRTSSEQERKLRAREAQMPALVEELISAAEQQQSNLNSRGEAKRALTSARDRDHLELGPDPAQEIQLLLDAGDFQEATTMVVQLATRVGGEAAADLACHVGQAINPAKHNELAVLCYTTAVLAAPPCDRACWGLCELAVARTDPLMAPIWLEFVARILRAQGADRDSIAVYRQLLALAPRRYDIRDLLRISSLTGVLPD
ncbi:MAG: hypothetical protein ACRENY_00450 [Candidatus Dormibacteria bacterium]